MHLRKENCAFSKAASTPTRQQSENTSPRHIGFIFRRCPRSRIFSISSETFQACPFPPSWPIKSTYKEHYRKDPRHNQDHSKKSAEKRALLFFSGPILYSRIFKNKQDITEKTLFKILAMQDRILKLVRKRQKTRKSRVQEVSRDRSRFIRPSLIAPEHSKTSVLGAFVPLKRGVTEL